MVTKVVTEHDVDNVTIIINPQNKLEAKIPTSTPSEVVIEEVPNVTPNNTVVTLNGTDRRITKLGKVSGTEWMVFQLDSQTPTSPPEPSQPPVATLPDTLITNVKCPRDIIVSGSGYEMDGALTIYHTLTNNSGKVPQSLVFTVNAGSQSREYTVPYPGPSVPHEWTSISDFTYEDLTDLNVNDIKVVFTDGSSVTSNTISPGCPTSSLPYQE